MHSISGFTPHSVLPNPNICPCCNLVHIATVTPRRNRSSLLRTGIGARLLVIYSALPRVHHFYDVVSKSQFYQKYDNGNRHVLGLLGTFACLFPSLPIKSNASTVAHRVVRVIFGVSPCQSRRMCLELWGLCMKTCETCMNLNHISHRIHTHRPLRERIHE